MKRALIVAAAACAAILHFLLTSASANTPLFDRYYRLLVVLNGLVAAGLLGIVGWQLRALWRDYRAKVFGSRLKLRLMLMFGGMAVLPGVIVYAVSVQFVTRSIESWFDVRVEKALESGLSLGRSAIDALLADLTAKARGMAVELGDRPEPVRQVMLSRLRERSGVHTASLYSLSGTLLGTAAADLAGVRLTVPESAELRQGRASKGVGLVDSTEGGIVLRVLVPVTALAFGEETRVLQVTQPLPASLLKNAEEVQAVYRDYHELNLARQGLTQIYALTLTLTVLLALSGAFALAFMFARRLSAPLSMLAEGTQAVAQGDFTPRQPVYSRDELGVLTQSFNQMTRQLDEARRETERHRSEVEASRAYVEGILANLSAGVMVFDRRFLLRLCNGGARNILGDDLNGLLGEPVDSWPRQTAFGRAVRDGFADSAAQEWQSQIELPRLSGPLSGMPQFLLLRGSKLPDSSGGGYVVVFDDITRLVAAQRSAAWGEVARRLAHEIKNPLTPIQLSAERLQHKLQDKLDPAGAETLQRSVNTIVGQVQAMKRMVDDFRDYARMPSPDLAPLDLNALVREVLALYENSPQKVRAELDPAVPRILGDATQLRQVIHNLLRNAQDALADASEGTIRVLTSRVGGRAHFACVDSGPGFPPDVLARVCEPYVTTKARGTGLGLAIVKKIVDEHHGRLAVGNVEPHGASVVIDLPAVVEECK